MHGPCDFFIQENSSSSPKASSRRVGVGSNKQVVRVELDIMIWGIKGKLLPSERAGHVGAHRQSLAANLQQGARQGTPQQSPPPVSAFHRSERTSTLKTFSET